MTYFPRRTLSALARQYFRHGAGRMRMLRRHRQLPRLRQLAAPVILLATLLSLALLPFSLWFASFPAAYAGACLIWALFASAQARDPWLIFIAPAAMITHFAWAAGFLRELLRMQAAPARPAQALEAVTP